MSNSSDIDGINQIQALLGSDYRLQWIVGHGGMSTVWLADDLRNNREVAVKVLKPEFSDNSEFLSRFRNEALAAENIQSDNVVRTYDYRETADESGRAVCFIIMEYIRGESLADKLARDGQLSEEQALNFFEQASHGLAAIHAMDLVHRDIKPGNLMVTEDNKVKITDFGIAKAAAAVPLTRTGMVVGTAQYVSPEQAQGLQVTSASDVYSLSTVAYEMLSGRRPFTGDSSVSVAIAHINQAAPPLPVSISAQARELVEIGMRKEPDRRFANGHELETAVSKVRLGQRPPQPSGSERIVASPEPSPTQVTSVVPPATSLQHARPAPQYAPPRQYTPAPKKKGNGGLIAIITLLLLALAGMAMWFVWDNANGKSDPQPTTVITTTPAQKPTTTAPPAKSATPPTWVPPKETTTVAPSPTPEETTKESPTPSPTPEKTKDTPTKTPEKTTDPKVSVPEVPLPTETVELPMPGTTPQNRMVTPINVELPSPSERIG